MGAWYSANAAETQRTADADILARLSLRALGRHRINEDVQLGAWRALIPIVRAVLEALPAPDEWHVLLEFEVPRLGGRLDAVLLSPRAIFVLEFRAGGQGADPAGQAQLDACALDLRDFHAGSRRHPIVPILVARDGVPPPATLPLLLAGVATVTATGAAGLPALVRGLDVRMPRPPAALDVAGWEGAAYRPVPNVIDAACLLYGGHDVGEIASARADAGNLAASATRIAQILAWHGEAGSKTVLFVTGIPGAGKTLCGLNAAFGAGTERLGASFLTGNPTLVHVLREALVRNAAPTPRGRRLAAHRIEGVIQALPRFRDHYVARPAEVPPERVVVIDEAQRCWTAAHAIGRTRDRPVPLSRSEPAHLLDIVARHAGFAGLVCLIGTGQEIHDGEGGLAEWGRALAERPEWRVHAAASATAAARNRLPRLPGMAGEPALHLAVPVRSLRHDATPAWVDRVLAGDEAGARHLVETRGDVPFRLTRDLASLRDGLRVLARDRHRVGLVASAGARRLRAEGLGCELPHMDVDAVSRWFLDSWLRDRDVRASDALELAATQFSVQGLELDHVGLCWDGDLVREGPGAEGGGGWQARSFRGTRWQVARDADKVAWRLNGYRVLLTRARYETVIWVPRGDADDPSRDPAAFERVADYLLSCGVRPLAGRPGALPLDPAKGLPLETDLTGWGPGVVAWP